MKYKVIFSDFDGTLLRTDHTVSERTIKAIKGYIAKGGTFIVNTGRIATSLDAWKVKLGIAEQKIPVIGFNGAFVTGKDGEVISSTFIEHNTACKILEKARELGVYAHFYTSKNVHIKQLCDISYMYKILTDAPLKVVGYLDDYLKAHPELVVPKILLVIPEEDRAVIEKTFDDMGLEGIQHVAGNKNFLEFVSIDSGKGNGMQKALDILGVKAEECIAIGDNENDASMIKKAGLGVAVANATEKAKEVADYISASNNDDGVAEVIEKFCGD